jgi:hypothetical protein
MSPLNPWIGCARSAGPVSGTEMPLPRMVARSLALKKAPDGAESGR